MLKIVTQKLVKCWDDAQDASQKTILSKLIEKDVIQFQKLSVSESQVRMVVRVWILPEESLTAAKQKTP